MQKSFMNSLNHDQNDLDLSGELNWLRLRTVHCKGLLSTDVKGTLLKRKIYDYLKSINDPGKILAILVFPDYSRLLGMEKKRLAIKDLEMIYMMEERKPSCFERCFPETFNSLEEYEKKFTQIEEKMQEEIEGVIESSGQCVLCFNNLKTAEICLKKFNNTSPFNFLISLYVSLRTRCCFKRNVNLERGFFSELRLKRRISTFFKYSESVYREEEEKNTKSFLPIMRFAPDPYDINWLNISTTSVSFLLCRRLLTNLSIFCVIVFCTTPLALMQALISESSMAWISYIPHPFNEIITSLLPSLFVILVNQIILLVIDYSSELENYSSFSGYQNSNLKKGVFYMLLNIILLPVLTIGTAESLFLFLMQGFSINWTEIFIKFYKNENLWSFYLLILMEQGVLSFIFYLLRLKELFFCVGNVTFAHYKRTFLVEKEVWRREVDDVFQYGYFSAQMIVCLTIAFIFGYQYPIMLIAGIIYLFFRHVGDAYNILIVNKNEMNSHGKFIQSVMIYTNIPLLLFQIIEIALIFSEKKYFQMGFGIFSILITLIIFVRMKRNLCTTENFEENEVKNEIKKASCKWQEFYQHPLVIQGFERFQDQEEEEIKIEDKMDDDKEKIGGKEKNNKKKKKIKIFSRKKIENLEKYLEY